MDPEELTRAIQTDGVPADHIPDVGHIVDLLAREAVSGDILLVLSNGGFGGIHQRLLDRLRAELGG